MASFLLPKGLTRQLLVVFILVALTSNVGVSLAAWQAERQALEVQVTGKLVAVANLKQERLNSWLIERQADARMIAVNRLNQEHFAELFDDTVPQARKNEFAAFLRDNLVGMRRSRAGYLEVSMTNRAGVVVISTEREREGQLALPVGSEKLRFSAIDGSFFCDIHPHSASGHPVMIFGNVIRAVDPNTHQETKEVIGEVITVVEMESTVYEFLGPISELGSSAEALLIRPEIDGILFLSKLLYLANAPLNLRASPSSPIAEAMRRISVNAFHSVDYTGETVIAVYRQIEPVGWGLMVKQAEAEAFAPIYELARRIVLLTFLVLIGTAILAFFLARTLIRPISALAQATQSIADGNLGVSLHSNRDDELGALSSSFQQMVEILAERRRETQRLTDILRRRADELESAYGDLRRTDQLKDAFIRNITHELRTPLTTLSGFTELLMDDIDEFGAEQQEMLDTIASQTVHITRLVNDVVALHEVHAVNHERRPLRLVEIVRASLDACRQQNEYGARNGKGIHSFGIDCANDQIEVMAHPGQMTRVVDNLLDNAVKFSPAGGLVHVQIRRVQKSYTDGGIMDWQVVSISDSGVGIAQDDLPHIWDRFFQVDHATTRRFGGAGLGLALVKETIEAHGGEVWIDSLAEEGTTVSFSVPVFQPEESTAVETESVSSP